MALLGFKKRFGLDISDASIEALEFEKVFGKIKIKSYGRVEIEPKKIVEDGLIKEKNLLIEAIKKVLEKSKPEKIRAKEVLISLPESRVFIHIFELPSHLKEKEIEEVISYEIESIFPYPSRELFLDFKIINKTDKSQEIFLAASLKRVINDFKEVLEGAGLIPVVFDMESKSLGRALIDKFEKNKGIIILDIGARTSIISVFDKASLRFTTNLKIAGNLFSQKISEGLNLSFSEAEKIKIKKGFLSERFGEILKKESESVCQELKRVIKYIERKYALPIEKIILAGGSSLLPGLREYFQEKIGLRVEIGDPLTKIGKNTILHKKEKRILFANVIGLGLRALEKNPLKSDINLLKS